MQKSGVRVRLRRYIVGTMSILVPKASEGAVFVFYSTERLGFVQIVRPPHCHGLVSVKYPVLAEIGHGHTIPSNSVVSMYMGVCKAKKIVAWVAVVAVID